MIVTKIILFDQTLKDIEKISREFGGYFVCYDELEHLSRKTWEEDYDYLCFDRFKKRDQGRFCICNENKNIFFECTPGTNPF